MVGGSTVSLLEELRRDSPHLHDRVDELAEVMARPADPQSVINAIKERRSESAHASRKADGAEAYWTALLRRAKDGNPEDPTAEPLIREPDQAPVQMARMQVDTLVGMGFSNIIALFIMLTTAATLNAHGVTDIQTSSQAAEALRPIAGRFAFTIFALGIIGTRLLAVPVLAGSAANAAERR
jgi:Natural resistance-associated macrophage protein